MRLLDAYRLALIEGLSARQAGIKFNLNHKSIAKCKTRYRLPTLKNEWLVAYEERMAKMNDTQLLSYHDTLMLPKNRESVRELRVCKEILKKRKLLRK
jgi:hypothetical protein